MKIKMVMYWAKILTAHESKLTNIIHFYFYKCYTEESFVHQWIKCVGHILNSCELSYVWINEKKIVALTGSSHLLKKILKTSLCKTGILLSTTRLNVLIIEF